MHSDEAKIELAIRLSRENVRRNTGGPFGSGVFRIETGELVSVGVNRVVPLNNSCAHGELLALMAAQKRLGVISLGGLELFTSCEPCAMCFGGVLWSGVRRLVCAATAADARAIGFDEGPVSEENYQYLIDRGTSVVREFQRKAAAQVLREYRDGGGRIYNG